MASGILLDDDGDLGYENGGFLIGDTDAQNISTICLAEPGSLKNWPTGGGGVIRLANARRDDISNSIRLIIASMQQDNWKNIKVDFDGENINADGNR